MGLTFPYLKEMLFRIYYAFGISDSLHIRELIANQCACFPIP